MKAWLPVAVTIVLLLALLAIVDVERVVQLLSRATPLLLFLATIATAFNVLVSSRRYQLILRALAPSARSLRDIFAINLVSVFAAHFLPISAAADGVRFALVRQKFGLDIRDAIESLLADRLIAIAGLCACAMLVLPAQALVGAPTSLIVSQLLPGAGLVVGGLVLVWSARRSRLGTSSWFEQIHRVVSAMGRHLVHGPSVQAQLALAILGALAFAGALWATARSLGATLTPMEALAFGPAIYLAQVLPFVYFGFGAREAATVFFLNGRAGLDAEAALSVGLALGFCNLLVALPAPLIAADLLRDWRRMRRRS